VEALMRVAALASDLVEERARAAEASAEAHRLRQRLEAATREKLSALLREAELREGLEGGAAPAGGLLAGAAQGLARRLSLGGRRGSGAGASPGPRSSQEVRAAAVQVLARGGGGREA
jgi:hypothetical protein